MFSKKFIEETKWKITIAQPGDSAGIARVHRESWMEAYPDPEVGLSEELLREHTAKFTSAERLKSWEETLRLQGQHKQVWVARIEKKIIGFCVAEKTDLVYELRSIYLLPAYNGKGVGQKLAETALSWLGPDREVCVWVFTHNKRAIEFYRKLGFKESGKTASLDIEGKQIPDLEMIRQIGTKRTS